MRAFWTKLLAIVGAINPFVISERDRDRLFALKQKQADYQDRIDAAPTERDRARYEQAVQDIQVEMRMMRTYSPSKFLRWSAIIAVVLPWALLGRAGHSVRGLIAGATVAIGLAALAAVRRRAG
jgi:hypothetical protein